MSDDEWFIVDGTDQIKELTKEITAHEYFKLLDLTIDMADAINAALKGHLYGANHLIPHSKVINLKKALNAYKDEYK